MSTPPRSKLRISTHQNSLLPYLGFWNKVACSDLFIINDADDLSNSFIHRTYTRTRKSDLEFLTLPIGRTKWHGKPIEQVEIENRQATVDMILGRLAFYHDYPYYKNIISGVKFCLKMWMQEKEPGMLADLNRRLFFWFKETLEIPTNTVSYTLEVKQNGVDTAERMAKQLHMYTYGRDSIYLSGSGGLNYLRKEPFDERNIEVLIQRPSEFILSERGPERGFTPEPIYNGTILDYLFRLPVKEVRNLVYTSYEWVNCPLWEGPPKKLTFYPNDYFKDNLPE